MNEFLMGAISLGFAVAALFFLRFWWQTHDRLFMFFSLAFLVLAVNRLALAFLVQGTGKGDHLYWVRLCAFLLILAGIVDKNRSEGA